MKWLGYSVQVGAFSNIENAVRMEEKLSAEGLDAWYFLHDSGLYKVRFGNYGSAGEAEAAGAGLVSTGVVDEYFLVRPEDYPSARPESSEAGVREGIVMTAFRFLGVPYRWGGTSEKAGFDCSGLAMVVYRLNGFDLPRSSRVQYRAGRRVSRSRLKKGDLVFFATRGGRRVSHVGIYIGEDRFIHAPRKGESVSVESMKNGYFRKTYVGGRTYGL